MSIPLVVFDAKTLILAYAFPGGPSSELLDRAIAGEIRAVVSPGILEEFARVLAGPALGLPAKLVSDWVDDLARICDTKPLRDGKRVGRLRLSREDSDVIACASSAGADHIVTGEKSRLLRLKSYRGITIADASTFLRRLTAPRRGV